MPFETLDLQDQALFLSLFAVHPMAEPRPHCCRVVMLMKIREINCVPLLLGQGRPATLAEANQLP
jgi:hypothetical protein